MIGLQLIVDAGATKTEWRIVGKGRYNSIFTIGISPYHFTQKQIEETLLRELPKSIFKKEFSAIHYYGTGCYATKNSNMVKKALDNTLTASKINVTHDTMGAALALCGREKGVVSILGTGSNSCYFDGKKIVANSPGLGYILGDEGSGAYLGKKVIQHYLYKMFDKPLMKSFTDTFQTDGDQILHHTYREPLANRYLASFAKFLSLHRGHFIIENIIEDGLRDFFNQHLLSYPQHKTYPVHFVGSIAYYFQDKLSDLCIDFGMTKGKVLKQPMDGLVAYHSS